MLEAMCTHSTVDSDLHVCGTRGPGYETSAQECM